MKSRILDPKFKYINAAATNAAATKGAGEKRTQNGREASK